MKIYTKTGDKGKTSLGSGERVWKNSKRVEAYGSLDELNTVLGEIIAELKVSRAGYTRKLIKLLTQIQNDLFAIQSNIANPQQSEILSLLVAHTTLLEKEIDVMTEKLPPIQNFILPGGGKHGAKFHTARTVARRAERRIVELMQEEEVDIRAVQYVNRLSDVFFTMARFSTVKDKKKEVFWSKSIYLKG